MKTFTHFPDVFQHDENAWWLDDHERGVPQVAEAFIRKAVELGIPRICAHKGFSGSSLFASPVDIGPAPMRHPDVDFVVYHSGTGRAAWIRSTRCEFTRRELAEVRKHLPGRDRTLGPATAAAAQHVRDHHWESGMP